MPTVQKSVRIPDEVAKAIQEEAETSGRDFSTVANEFLAEGVKLKRCPGIIFADGTSGRRPCIAGTGLDVWEIVAIYKSLNRDDIRLREAYHWLSEPQLSSALSYYRLYPQEIERQIARNESWSKEQLADRHPSLVRGPWELSNSASEYRSRVFRGALVWQDFINPPRRE